MGGIKHNRGHMNPAMPRVPMPDGNSTDGHAWAAWAQQSVQVACRICGQEIVMGSSGSMGYSESGLPTDEQWAEEVEAGMHKDCYMKYMMIQRMKQNGS